MSRGFYIKTMGCQMNAHDSDYLAQSLMNKGFLPVPEPEQAQVILINTCVVRAKPEQKAYSFLGRASAIKKAHPEKFLGIIGCLAQMKGERLLQRFPQVDLIMGPRELARFPEILERIDDEARGKFVATRLDSEPPEPMACQAHACQGVTGFVSVMEGCDNFCSYCIVPYVRGRETSRSPEAILNEAAALLSRGVKEITLLGQNVNSYLGTGKGGRRLDFSNLLHEMSRLDGLLRLRFVTSHPKDLSDDLISCFGEMAMLCPHIHLPFQAGSNRILKRMRRGYSREDYLLLIKKLRTVQPDIAISSDVMVGFPGETEEDFEWTLDLIRRVQFDSLFSFKYSDRTGTAAERMPDKIDERIKSSRLNTLQGIQKDITLSKNMSLEGKELEILVEGHSKQGGQLSGRTGSNRIVNFIINDRIIGELINVNIVRSFSNSLWGEPTDSCLSGVRAIPKSG